LLPSAEQGTGSIQSGLHPRSYQLKLAPKTLAAATSVNATIVTTIYAPVAT